MQCQGGFHWTHFVLHGWCFQITIGYPEVYVELHIIWMRKERVIHIDQTWYIISKLKKYGYENCNPVIVPIGPNSVFTLSLHMGNGSIENQFFPLQRDCWELAICTLLTFHLQSHMKPNSPKTHKCNILQHWNASWSICSALLWWGLHIVVVVGIMFDTHSVMQILPWIWMIESLNLAFYLCSMEDLWHGLHGSRIELWGAPQKLDILSHI